MMKPLTICLLALAACLSAAEARADAYPTRVVSMNLCTDILALELAAPGTVKSVFRVAADPHDSPVAGLARDIPLNDASAEEILSYKPDLVLAHRYSSPFTLDILRRAHVPVLQVADAATFDDIRDNVRRVAAALGRQAEGEKWLAAFDKSLAAAARPAGAHPPRAVIYQDLGGAAAAHTILGALLEHTGFDNVVKREASGEFVNLTIEQLIDMRPDFVAIGIYRPYEPSLAHAVLYHPALQAYISRYARTTDLPARLWTCGTPFVADIAKRLAAARDAFDVPAPARTN
jgi:iron complex transport system substrate-binding protein